MIPTFPVPDDSIVRPALEWRSLHPMQRSLGEAICLEYQLQNAAAMLWDDEALTDRQRALLHAIHHSAIEHIADLDPEVREAQALDRSEIAQQIAEAERLFGPTSSTPHWEHVGALCGLLLEATLTYESLVLSAALAQRHDLAALARQHLASWARALRALDAERAALLSQELQTQGEIVSGASLARALERIAEAPSAALRRRVSSDSTSRKVTSVLVRSDVRARAARMHPAHGRRRAHGSLETKAPGSASV